MTTTLGTPPPVVGTSRREWDVRVRGDLVRVFIRDASTIENNDLSSDDPRTRGDISLRAEQARELALELEEAARHIKEEVLEEWGLD